MPSTHFASAHFASIHFLSNHFSGGTAQVVTVEAAGGWDAIDKILLRVPNGDIVVLAAGALLLCDDDLDD